MTFKDKLILVLLSILTLGIYPIVLYRKKEEKEATELSSSEKISINIEKLKSYLGENNIAGSEYTHTKVKVFIHDRNKVQIEQIQGLKGVSGIFATTKYVTMIVGNQAKKVAELL